MMKMGRRKKKNKEMRSERGKRRAQSTQTTGNVLRIVGLILMIIFYFAMIQTLFNYRVQIDALINDFSNSTQPGAFHVMLKCILIITKGGI